MLVGEIGITTGQFYYGLRWWEIKSIIRGYNRRRRDIWSATRWQTYNLMCAFGGSDSLAKSGINSPKDLLPLPWDTDEVVKSLTDEEINDIQADIAAWNTMMKDESSED